ncbi:sensor histidine kinase [Desulfohalovibrio reitneri]|uniref:sensor histidine kinase n=1 Tax=Desulfohalovibrio reitneri TaxID=1307759 RepID=UPI00068D7C02|nr:HAMP domain-containing sensor histidine kinase [Desulfohalovibrio reitneri]
MAHTTFKGSLIIILTAAVTALHFAGGDMELHVVHRELYFVPILLAAYWYGLKWGLITAGAAGVLYLAGMLFAPMDHAVLVMVSQIAVFVLVALVLGWLTDHNRRRQERLIQAEKLGALGSASSVIGHEMRDIMGALNSLFQRSGGLADSGLNDDFQKEMSRMGSLVETLAGYVPERELKLRTANLNEVVEEAVRRNQEQIDAKEVRLDVQRDEVGCPTKVDPEAVRWVVARLVENALDFTPRGSTVTVTSTRSGDDCTIRVADQGPGIKPEHREKMFSPFFTTRRGGTGLTLPSCRKTVRNFGGDLTFESEPGQGATFIVRIPRGEG